MELWSEKGSPTTTLPIKSTLVVKTRSSVFWSLVGSSTSPLVDARSCPELCMCKSSVFCSEHLSHRFGWPSQGGGGLATAFDLAAFWLSMVAPVKKSVNHSRIVASMRETGWKQKQQEVCLRSDSTVWSEFAFGPVGHCFLCCNQFLSAVMWSLRFPFFWSCVCHYMRFTTLRMRPVNIDREQTLFLDAGPFDSLHLDAGSQAVFLFRRPTRLKEGPTLQYVCRRVHIFNWRDQN